MNLSDVFIINFERSSHFFLEFPLFSLSKWMPAELYGWVIAQCKKYFLLNYQNMVNKHLKK